ncbi:threonylcarbamoyl-AMP synthase [Candidatus Uhrbacteria bacterium]|nr:threonylcarbamoyl-AMP synthase [Candidatus Uhrbacteria bacterium]
MKMNLLTVASLLRKGKIGVMPTDTLYGLVGSALLPEVVDRVYRVRKRNRKKPMIVLIASKDDLAHFGIILNSRQAKLLKQVWPGPHSIILPCCSKKYHYLHRGKKSLAFRVPADEELRRFLQKTGPLVAPSANPEGRDPARTIRQARAYFGESIDFYIRGYVRDKPSEIIEISNSGTISKVR